MAKNDEAALSFNNNKISLFNIGIIFNSSVFDKQYIRALYP
jgi:hypothetical protein